MSRNKPRYVAVSFGAAVYFDIEVVERDLGIKWDDVEKWWVKWGRLHLQVGERTLEVVAPDVDIDWKRPTDERLLDEECQDIDIIEEDETSNTP